LIERTWQEFTRLHLFVEANPITLKWAMAKLVMCGPAMRLPLTPLSSQ
jgi:4-hydroxy-tetrahydrodipicolinate synthase